MDVFKTIKREPRAGTSRRQTTVNGGDGLGQIVAVVWLGVHGLLPPYRVNPEPFDKGVHVGNLEQHRSTDLMERDLTALLVFGQRPERYGHITRRRRSA
jgi:hypothetical protein